MQALQFATKTEILPAAIVKITWSLQVANIVYIGFIYHSIDVRECVCSRDIKISIKMFHFPSATLEVVVGCNLSDR